MADPTHTKVCLTCREYPDPALALFLAPEPLVRGGCILHLVEQVPVRAAGTTRLASELTQLMQSQVDPNSSVRAEFRTFTGTLADAARTRAVLHDHLINDPEPIGLDTTDADEMTRLATLPEQPIGPRRVDDFQDHAVRMAMLAVYRHFDVDQRIPVLYHGYADPTTGWFALRASSA
ncbi:hypothetical protein [Nocardia sp. XZ_19_385]|uniref:hypothetical protein n=1 Tax=Nocardia sp. XZ_19_385 TaxID=2769488 RepID=UPI00189036EF|nr:hypothetical protein [Nocardia sp. XZ_19_385]